jgi:hypothetical protein
MSTASTTSQEVRRPTPPTGARLDRLLRGTTWAAIGAKDADIEALRVAAGVESGVVIKAAANLAAAEAAGAALAVVCDPQAKQDKPEAMTVVVADAAPTLDRALLAVRSGATDYLPGTLVSLDPIELRRRLRVAAARQWADRRLDRRLDGLTRTVRRLDQARKTVSEKVDLLCRDLVHAYGDVARQVEDVKLDRSLRDLLGSAEDLEQLLCHLMDWLLRHGGNTNLAIFLETEGGQAELGAYMKHTVPGEDAVVSWLQRHALPAAEMAASEAPGNGGIFRASAEKLLPHLDPLDPAESQLIDHQMLAVSCGYLSESIGAIVMFRRDDEPMEDRHVDLLRIAAPAFAAALTHLVHDGPAGVEDEPDDDDDEWWQRGGSPEPDFS